VQEEGSEMNGQMGSSSSLCDYILKHQLEEIVPKEVVDFGAGAGKIGKIVKESLGLSCRIVAVEGYERAANWLVEQGCYDEVHYDLLQRWIDKDTQHYDLAIFGDVLEHLTPREIHQAIKRSLKKFDCIIIVCPLQDIFQNAWYENPLEVHRTYIVSHFFDRYKPIEKHIVRGDDWTIMNVRISSELKTNRFYRHYAWSAFHVLILLLQPLGLARFFVDFLKRYCNRYKWLLRD
jgi:hypothetical protein